MQRNDANDDKEALFYERLHDESVHCYLCPHHCVIDVGSRGICQVRENRNGKLYSLVYGRPLAQNVDNVEKKPLFHFHPGSTAYSIGTQGCNLHCQYCINWEVSQSFDHHYQGKAHFISPSQIIDAALKAGCSSIAYTYVEPAIFWEYVIDIARLAYNAGLHNILKTNGFMTSEALGILEPYLNAANVDLKTFREATYKRFGGRLQPVLDSLKQMEYFGTWLEISTVIIPGWNDDPIELKEMASFIAEEIGIDTPWHLARFFPAYKMESFPPTPIETLQRTREIGLSEGLHHVYISSVLGGNNQNTLCTGCQRILIERKSANLIANHVQDHSCPHCKTQLAGFYRKNLDFCL